MLYFKRREFIALLGGAVAWPCVVAAQGAKKRPVIGMLGQGTPVQLKGVQLRQYFLHGMRELGYVEGRDFDIVGRLAESSKHRTRQFKLPSNRNVGVYWMPAFAGMTAECAGFFIAHSRPASTRSICASLGVM